MCYRFLLFAALILAFITSSSTRKLQNRDDEKSVAPAPNITFPGTLLVVQFPPRTFILGVLLVVALNIVGEPSSRLSSVVAQELLNGNINAIGSYFLILNEYSVVEVTEQLEQVANKTGRLQIEDLQILTNASTCPQLTSNLTVSQIDSVVFRLESLFREGSNLTLSLGCSPQENITSTSIGETESTTVSSNVTETTASERRNHGAARHGPALHPDKTRHQKGIHGVSFRDHGEKHQQANAHDHNLNIRDHHLHTRNHHKERNTHLQHDVAHDHHKERNAYLEPHQH